MSDSASRKAVAGRRGRGFLARLARDVRGNTLVIVGAALFPLAAMIGSGVDMSRAYMAKHRLQTACDAAALAGRRVMQDDTMTPAVEAEAVRFFRFNFPQTNIPQQGSVPAHTEGPYATEGVTPTVTRPGPGTVRVTASTRIPTTVMKMFGFSTLPLTVTCDAALHFVNTDVMLVLDTTGSMNRDINDNNTNNDSLRKITALRAAVMALYDELRPTQTQLEANGLRLRYGIVPYSSSVNVGNLITAVNPAFMRDASPYQSREVLYDVPHFTDTPITAPQAGLLVNPGVQRFQSGGVDRAISNTNCGRFGNNRGFTQSGWTYTAIGPNNDPDIYDPDGPAGPQANAPAAGTSYIRYQFSRNTPAWSNNPTNRVCDRNVTITRRFYTGRFTVSTAANPYRYIESSFDTTQLRGGSTTIATNTGGSVPAAGFYNDRRLALEATGVATTSVPWNGCIEERTSVSTIATSTDLSIPAGAFDLNINHIPDSEDTRWRPHWPQMLWGRDVNQLSTTNVNDTDYMGDDTGDSVACPSPARRLQAWTEADLQTYVNGLTPRGYTYHDIGMIWGARLLSNAGVFAADNPDTFASMPVTRHIIFMTDGVLMPQCAAYSSWGIERNDRRVTGQYNCQDQYDRHMQRFKMICNAARGMGYSIWVIAFGVTLTPEMASCASNPNQASTSTSSADLMDRFRQIGANIGALRLTQ